MRADSLTITITTDASPAAATAAIADVGSWWSGDIEGTADAVGDEFTYRYADLHRSRQRVAELVPGERVVWHVVDSDLAFTADRSEWTGTDLVFAVRRDGDRTVVDFVHDGLVPAQECFTACAPAWQHYVGTVLRERLARSAG